MKYFVLLAIYFTGSAVDSLPTNNLLRRSSTDQTYFSHLEDVIYRMVDTDNDGGINSIEISEFLALPGVPNFLKDVFTGYSISQVDSNNNGKLERYELQSKLFPVVEDSVVGGVIKALIFETVLMIQRGEIVEPETPEEEADLNIAVLDTDDSGTISRDEAYAYYKVVVPDNVWRLMWRTALAVDKDGDEEINRQEAIEWYRQSTTEFGSLSTRGVIIYGRIRETIGHFPKLPQF